MSYLSHSLAFIAGALAVLGFAPFGYWWIIFPSLAILYFLISSLSPRRCFQVGFFYGLGYFGAGISWVFNSLYDYGKAPLIVAAGLTVLLIIYTSLFPALTTWLFARLRASGMKSGLNPLLFAASWTVFEWLRGWLFSGFPWLSIGHVFPDSLLSGWIPIVGTLGVGFVMLVMSSSFVTILTMRGSARWIAVAMVVILLPGTLWLGGKHWTRPMDHTDPLKVTLVQGNVGHELKWDRERRSEVYSRYLNLSLNHPNSDIIVWPETAIPTFYASVANSLVPILEKQMASIGAQLITGVFTYDQANGKIYNSLAVIGGEKQVYSKKHLVPFGEFLPFRWLFNFMNRFITIPMSDLSPGDGPSILRVKDIIIGASICYEAAFSNEIAAELPDANLLVNVTNDAWFGDSLAPHQHLQIAQSRSLETGRWMMRATNNGISAIIDELGHVRADSKQFEATTVHAEVVPMQGSTPFVRWRNTPIVILVMTILFIMLLLQRKQST